MNTKEKQEEKKDQRQRLSREPEKQPMNGDIWEMLHGDANNYEHERLEMRLTR